MIPTQDESDFSNPKEHFAWALRNLPMIAGAGMITHPGFLKAWSEHLWNCGFAHRDWLAGLADEDGNIHVSKLPNQSIKFQQAVRGPWHGYNNAARWVPANAPAPPVVNLPDIRELTIQEREAVLGQYRDMGLIPQGPPQPDVAEVES